jgi:hypothetical protein
MFRTKSGDPSRKGKSLGDLIRSGGHEEKGRGYAKALEDWLRNNPNATPLSRDGATKALNDVRQALAGD